MVLNKLSSTAVPWIGLEMHTTVDTPCNTFHFIPCDNFDCIAILLIAYFEHCRCIFQGYYSFNPNLQDGGCSPKMEKPDNWSQHQCDLPPYLTVWVTSMKFHESSTFFSFMQVSFSPRFFFFVVEVNFTSTNIYFSSMGSKNYFRWRFFYFHGGKLYFHDFFLLPCD